jgi:hypothetical protein
MLFLWSSGSQRHVKLAGKRQTIFLTGDPPAAGYHDQATGRTNDHIEAAILLIAETAMALLVLHSA